MRREILQTIAIALLLTGQAATALECDGFVVSREEPDLIAAVGGAYRDYWRRVPPGIPSFGRRREVTDD